MPSLSPMTHLALHRQRQALPRRKAAIVRPPVKWHGGKTRLAKRIIAHFPPHHTYVEPYGGSAAVLLNKPPSPVEIYNDIDQRITNLFRVLRDDGDRLRQSLTLTPYSEAEFRQAKEPANNALEQARRDFVRWRLSFGGHRRAFSCAGHRSRRGMSDAVSAYLSVIDEQMPAIIRRLRQVHFLCRPAIQVIRQWDSPKTLIYCDPPYLPETRHPTARNVYAVEMSEDDHRELAEVLNKCQSKVVLSGYPSPLYRYLYSSWRTVTFDVAAHASVAAKKSRKQEMLWFNW